MMKGAAVEALHPAVVPQRRRNLDRFGPAPYHYFVMGRR
jgi:hypothetical protein